MSDVQMASTGSWSRGKCERCNGVEVSYLIAAYSNDKGKHVSTGAVYCEDCDAKQFIYMMGKYKAFRKVALNG